MKTEALAIFRMQASISLNLIQNRRIWARFPPVQYKTCLPPRRNVLSAAELDGQLYLFARETDGKLSQAIENNGNWTWQNWDLSNQQFLSQPSAMIWNSPKQLNVFALRAGDGVVLTKPFKNGINGDEIHIWVREDNSKQIIHNYWQMLSKYWNSNSASWENSMNNDVAKGSLSAPSVVCRNTTTFHDVVIFEKDSGLALHKQYTSQPIAWTSWKELGWPYTGDPVIVSPAINRVDFFGILKANQTMIHRSWNGTSDYTEPFNLGGTWVSVPSIIVGDNNRLDILALGIDGALKHRALLDSIWNADWNDLGISGSSAPLAIKRTTEPARIIVLILDMGGKVIQSVWEPTADGGLKSITTSESIGGSFSRIGVVPA
ncbi:hypothetical protein B0O99DRAFT_602074 [Bisporella sp. PMI_857]|nr:hypothetical protein B0O99DRAFT_602074 [Bisporella sp. PMI_857]